MEIPDNILNKLKCTQCHAYLSCGPIYYHPKIGTICGRHPKSAAHRRMHPINEIHYELLAGLMLFPCRYTANGCSKKFSIQQMAVHEVFCIYKSFLCPLKKCSWQGPNHDLSAHLFHHNPLIAVHETVDIELHVEKNLKKQYLIAALNQFFMLRIDFEDSPKTSYCCVHLLGKINPANTHEHEYKIMLKTRDDEFSWSHLKRAIQPYFIKCQQKKECEFPMAALRSIFQLQPQVPRSLILRVQLTDVSEASSSEESSEEDSDNESVLEAIQCPVCKEYMVPPIHQCITGHTFCNRCRPRLTACPMCRDEISDTRNFSLERLTEDIMYPCAYTIDGCTFKIDSTNIRQHERECDFKPWKCAFRTADSCKWVGQMAFFYQHCIETHPKYVQSSAYHLIKYCPLFEHFETFTVKSCFGLVFKMRYWYTSDKVACTVQCMARPRGNLKFMYEVQIIDLNNGGMQLLSRKKCAGLSDCKYDAVHCSLWDLDMVKPLISPDKSYLKFKCIILKHF